MGGAGIWSEIASGHGSRLLQHPLDCMPPAASSPSSPLSPPPQP